MLAIMTLIPLAHAEIDGTIEMETVEISPFAGVVPYQCYTYEFPDKFERVCIQSIPKDTPEPVDEEPIPEEPAEELGEMPEIDTEEVIPDEAIEYWERVNKVIAHRADDPSEQELIQKINVILEDKAKCFYGADHTATAGMQKYKEEAIPTIIVPLYTIDEETGEQVETGEFVEVLDTTIEYHGELKGYLAKLISDIEECKAQMTLTNTNDGDGPSIADTHFAFCDELSDTLTAEQSIQSMCGMSDEQYYATLGSKIAEVKQEVAKAEMEWQITTREFEDPTCNPHNYSLAHRLAFNCPDPYGAPLEITKPTPPVYDYEVENEVYKNYKKFQSGDYSEQHDKVVKAAYDKKVQQLYKELRATLQQQAEEAMK